MHRGGSRPSQMGVGRQTPSYSSQVSGRLQSPQLPPQSSSPQLRPKQLGRHGTSSQRAPSESSTHASNWQGHERISPSLHVTRCPFMQVPVSGSAAQPPSGWQTSSCWQVQLSGQLPQCLGSAVLQFVSGVQCRGSMYPQMPSMQAVPSPQRPQTPPQPSNPHSPNPGQRGSHSWCCLQATESRWDGSEFLDPESVVQETIELRQRRQPTRSLTRFVMLPFR